MTERISASRIVPMSRAAVFEVLSDPDGHVAIDASGMLQGATGSEVTRAGDTFTAHMDREALGDLPMGQYDVQVVITQYVEATAIEWTIEGTVKPPIGHVYGYELADARADDAGVATRVTSYCDWSNAAPEWKAIFPVIDEKALRASLGLLERAARRGYPRPSA